MAAKGTRLRALNTMRCSLSRRAQSYEPRYDENKPYARAPVRDPRDAADTRTAGAGVRAVARGAFRSGEGSRHRPRRPRARDRPVRPQLRADAEPLGGPERGPALRVAGRRDGHDGAVSLQWADRPAVHADQCPSEHDLHDLDGVLPARLADRAARGKHQAAL